MKNNFQIIILNKNSEFNRSLNFTPFLGYLFLLIFITLLGLSFWGLFRLINPHKKQEILNQNISLKYNTIDLLNQLIETHNIDTTILNHYKINQNYNSLIPDYMPVDGIVTKAISHKKKSEHYGIDIAATLNDKVKSAQEGLVVFSGEFNDYGNTIILAHPNNYYTVYSHLSNPIVEQRDYVKMGDIIGYIGESGKSNGPHLHFEIWKNHAIIDPRNLIKEYRTKDVSIK